MVNSPLEARWQSPWSPRRRRVVSILLVLHLLAVVAAPWAAPPPSPRLAQELARWLWPYQVVAYLNHGYRFFAPNPGPSHIVRYEMELPDGRQLTGRIPDPHGHWPRVIYHRHFMMTETLFNAYMQIDREPVPKFPTEQLKRQWQQRNQTAQELVDLLAGAMARQLLREQGGQRVRLYLQEHAIAHPDDVHAGMPLDEPRLYLDVTMLGPFEKGAS